MSPWHVNIAVYILAEARQIMYWLVSGRGLGRGGGIPVAGLVAGQWIRI